MKWQRDKWKHFYVGIAMGAFLQGLAWWAFPNHHLFATTAVFIVVIGISYGFELFSLFTGKGHYEVMDAIAAIIGGVLGMGIIFLLQIF